MKEFLKLRQELYKQTLRSVEQILGREGPGLRRYRREYDKIFNLKWRPNSRDKFLNGLSSKAIIFVSDFHALQQSQRAQLRLLNSIEFKKSPVIALECIEQRYQKHLDEFILGKISEKIFLDKVQWRKSWGFPWESYRPLFLWAKKHKSLVLALNSKVKANTEKTLVERDYWAAQRIVEQYKKDPSRPIFVCFGDLHLAPKHLPEKVIRLLRNSDLSYAVVLQNSEKIYFQMLKKRMDLHVDVVQLSKNYFCLQSVPPWVKWENYLLFLESYQESRTHGLDELDFTDHIKKTAEILCKDLDIKINLDHVAVYTISNDELWDKLSAHFFGSKLKWFQKKMEASEPFYVPELQLGFLGRPTVNQSAILAAQIVCMEVSQLVPLPIEFPKNFEHWIWFESITYFCTKLINPKRKTDTMTDIRGQLTKSGSKAQEQEALRMALQQKMNELKKLRGVSGRIKSPRSRSLFNYGRAARLLGGMLGEKLYHGFRKGWISREGFVQLLQKSGKTTDFSSFYFEILKLIDHWPEPFVSKSHKM